MQKTLTRSKEGTQTAQQHQQSRARDEQALFTGKSSDASNKSRQH